ncbi:MAG: DUF177 domain-containing protein [Bacteroidales bacterium]|nr:DUF177 domain-containing protein [Bacteroidales bacterium]
MKLGNQYIIPFKGLKDGEHDFRFSLEQKFFDEHELLESPGGDINVNIVLNKMTTMLTLSVSIEGEIDLQCDRCLDYFKFQVKYTGRLVVKFGETSDKDNDEMWFIHPNEHELNLEQYLYECLSLSLPIRKIHPDKPNGESNCNPEMLKKLESHKLKHKLLEEYNDPRWNGLKDLLNDTNNN